MHHVLKKCSYNKVGKCNVEGLFVVRISQKVSGVGSGWGRVCFGTCAGWTPFPILEPLIAYFEIKRKTVYPMTV